MSAIVPYDEQDEFPTGFTIVGHVGTRCLQFSFTMLHSIDFRKRISIFGSNTCHINT